jgi:hypothetical protein
MMSILVLPVHIEIIFMYEIQTQLFNNNLKSFTDLSSINVFAEVKEVEPPPLENESKFIKL